MPKCPECDRLTHLTRRGPTRLNVYALICVVGALVYAVFWWGADHLFHSKPRTPGQYLALCAFFGTLFYWIMLARVHATHTGQPINWRALLAPRGRCPPPVLRRLRLVDWLRL